MPPVKGVDTLHQETAAGETNSRGEDTEGTMLSRPPLSPYGRGVQSLRSGDGDSDPSPIRAQRRSRQHGARPRREIPASPAGPQVFSDRSCLRIDSRALTRSGLSTALWRKVRERLKVLSGALKR